MERECVFRPLAYFQAICVRLAEKWRVVLRHTRASFAFDNWLPRMDLHHNVRFNRPTGSFTSQGKMKMVPAPGLPLLRLCQVCSAPQ